MDPVRIQGLEFLSTKERCASTFRRDVATRHEPAVWRRPAPPFRAHLLQLEFFQVELFEAPAAHASR